ncbi:hypothetical protein [Halorubrum sp. AJ67]|uniref:hypothetical protein n=1 Tax=Halorubrum sp. AJ67 TaxID=1173487 RepID=UPI00064EDBD5|nr:hypothetical protein [Halorubrum sp. AJ67]
MSCQAIRTGTVDAIDKTPLRVSDRLDGQLDAPLGSFYSSMEVQEMIRKQALGGDSSLDSRRVERECPAWPLSSSPSQRGLYSSGMGEGELEFSSLNGVRVVIHGEDDSERRRALSVQVRGLGNLYTQFGVGGEEIEAVQTDCLGANPQTADTVAVSVKQFQ